MLANPEAETLPYDELVALKLNHNKSNCKTNSTNDSSVTTFPYPNFAPEEERVHLLNIFKDLNFPSALGKTPDNQTIDGANPSGAALDASEIASLTEKYNLFKDQQAFTDMLASYPNIREEIVARYLGFFPTKKKACEQLDNAILYRSTNSILSYSDVEEPIKTGFFHYHGLSKDDACVAYFALDNHSKHSRVASVATYIKAMIYTIEKEAQKVGKNELMKTCLLVDRRKATSKNQDLELIKEVLNVITCLYPNSMPNVLVCPCNLGTRLFFNLLTPLLDKNIVESTKLVKDVKEIEQYVDKDQLKEGFES